ncbi:MAG: hypothetical protein AAGA54_20130 [Myxococcota bacterium]
MPAEPVLVRPPIQLSAPEDLRLRDVARLNVDIAIEVAEGASVIRLVGPRTMTEGSRIALQGLADRLGERGVELQMQSR